MAAKPQSHDLGVTETREEALSRIKSYNTVTLSPELFEKLYLQPLANVKGDLRKTFANPTPLGLIGFSVALTPLACCLLGWRGAGHLGAANIGVFYFIGGPLQIICGVLEFFLGNTFPFAVFTTYGCIFLALAGTLTPFYGSAAAYSATGSFAEGLGEPSFNSSLAFWPLAIAILNLFFLICATKINAVFVFIFFGAGLGFSLLCAALFALGDGLLDAGSKLLIGTGAAWFFTAILAWYLLLVQLLGIMDFGLSLPVGDLSRFWNRTPSHKSDEEA